MIKYKFGYSNFAKFCLFSKIFGFGVNENTIPLLMFYHEICKKERKVIFQLSQLLTYQYPTHQLTIPNIQLSQKKLCCVGPSL